MLNNIYTNNKGCQFKVVEYINAHRIKIKYLDNFGYETWTEKKAIIQGMVKNPYYPSVHNIGYIGDMINPTKHLLYARWKKMLQRCYCENDKHYKAYGGCGIKVSIEWLNFSTYASDIQKMEHYEDLATSPHLWHIDKDILSKGEKMYSNETCIIISREHNCSIADKTNIHKSIGKYDLEDNLITVYDCVKNAKEMTGVQKISSCLTGKRKTAGGYKWKYITTNNS